MASHSHHRALVFGLLLIIAPSSYADETQKQIEQANSLISQGRHADAETAFGRILSAQPKNIEALLGRATLRAWRGDHRGAQQDFNSVLRLQPDHLAATVGLAYDFAWAGQFDAAETQFKRAQQIAPGNSDAAKGLAYVALWRGDNGRAVERFRHLEVLEPTNPEAALGIGQAEFRAGHIWRSEKAFQRVLRLDPSNQAAKDGLKASYVTPALIEASVWVGKTTDVDPGLRQLELASWLRRDWRVWLRYDDSLSRDNPGLDARGINAEAYHVGAFHEVTPHWLASLELGTRTLPDNQSQDTIKVEGAHLHENKVYKLGVQLAPHSAGYTDKLIYGGIKLPLDARWNLEPTLFIANSGASSDSEWRLVGLAEYNIPQSWGFGINLGYGNKDAQAARDSGSVFFYGATWYMPVAGYHRLSLSVQKQETPSQQSLTTMLGITLRMPRM